MINRIGKTHPGNPLYKASFCPRHGNRQARGAFRIAGLFFCNFSCPPRKVKGKSRLIQYGALKIPGGLSKR